MAVSCAGWIEPLNLQCLLVNTFAGSIEIFTFLMIIFIAGMGAYFRMINVTILIMFGLFAILMSQFMGGVYFLAILVTGLFVAFAIGRIVKQ